MQSELHRNVVYRGVELLLLVSMLFLLTIPIIPINSKAMVIDHLVLTCDTTHIQIKPCICIVSHTKRSVTFIILCPVCHLKSALSPFGKNTRLEFFSVHFFAYVVPLCGNFGESPSIAAQIYRQAAMGKIVLPCMQRMPTEGSLVEDYKI